MLSFNKYNELVEIIYQIATEPKALSWLLEFFAENTYMHGGSLTVHNTKTLETIKRISVGVASDPQYRKEYKNDMQRVDVWTQALLTQHKQGHFAGDHQFFLRDKFDKSELKPLLSKYDSYSATGAHWHLPDNQTLRISFQKNSTHGLFNDDELLFLNSLVNHIGRAIELNIKFKNTGSHKTLVAVIEQSDQSIALISSSSCVFISSPSFEKLAEKQRAFTVSVNAVSFINIKTQQYFEHILRQISFNSLNVDAPLSFIIPSGDDDADYKATLVPILNGISELKILLTITPVAVRLLDKFDHLLAQKILTQSELDVAYKLSQNLSLTDIANIKNRSVHTIRTQVKSIQRKFGVNSQAGIVSKILTF
ncbi:MAG: hypothetical protein MJK12_20630 [Colwellia sp.]|nr:hypothetical protein [Colwellia sp.]